MTTDTAERMMHALAAVIRDTDSAAALIGELTDQELALLHDVSINLSVAVRAERITRRGWPVQP